MSTSDPQFSYGPEWLRLPENLGQSAWNFARDELFGYDDFSRVAPHWQSGNYLGAGLSALTGVTEAGLTGLALLSAPLTGGASLPARAALTGGRAAVGQAVRNVPRGLFRALNPFGGTVARGRLRPALMQAGRYAAGNYDPSDPDAAAAAAEDLPVAGGFDMDLSGLDGGAGGGGGGRAGVPRANINYDELLPLGDFQIMLENTLDNINARATAYQTALGTEWEQIGSTNKAAAERALELSREFGELGAQRWTEAAEGALAIAASRVEALGSLIGGAPMDFGSQAATSDFAQQAQLSGTAEQRFQESLGERQSRDYEWAAQQAAGTGAEYQAAVGRAAQDQTYAAVAAHNDRIIQRQNLIAQMRFQQAMQEQQLGAQASAANAARGAQPGRQEELFMFAASLKDRNAPASGAAAMIMQMFPGVFPTPNDAIAFYQSLGTAP
jgi:hypothetical protein